jgi:CubicO group peptidase (beta-lactamase class C family)
MDLVHGTCAEKFGLLQTLLLQFIESGEELGGSITVNIDGQNVVDIWGGYFDEGRTQLWERDTITNVFSTTKTVTALAGLMLVDRGLLDFNAKVSQYWPEFNQSGKGDIEVRHVLTHNTGLPGWEQPVSLEDVCDFEKLPRCLQHKPHGGSQELLLATNLLPWGTSSGN